MAYTRAPVNDTHNVIRVGVSGNVFMGSDANQDTVPATLNYINCFPVTEKQWGQDPRRTIHKRQAFEKAAAASGTISGSGVCGRTLVLAPGGNNTTVFFAKNSSYYMFDYSTFAVSEVTTSTTATEAQKAAGTVAVDSTNAIRIAFLDTADELKTFLQDGTSVTTTTTGRDLDGSLGLVFLNGYLFAVDSTGYKIHNSTAGGVLTTWASTDYIAAEQYADPIRWLDKHKNHLVAFGSKSTEFFYDAAIEVGSPLARQEAYSREIGLFNTTYAGKQTCHIDDDLYFLGSKDNDNIALYRIRNFQIEEIACPWVEAILNANSASISGIETFIVNNKSNVMINVASANYSILYSPEEDSWWLMSQGDAASNEFGDPTQRLGTQFYSQAFGVPMFLGVTSVTSTTLYYYVPDTNWSTSVTATITTPVVDMGINYYKHIARVDAVGDFGSDNTITLKYNPTPDYQQSYVTCTPTRTPGTAGLKNNASWYNIGPWRRGSFQLSIAGFDRFIYEGLDIEYNVGMT